MSAFVHRLAVRYGECDQQGVVFNANYLAYVDDTMDRWMRSLGDLGVEASWTDGWDVMLKRATVEWHAPARWPEELAVRPSIERWGTSSFDARFELSVEDTTGSRPVATVIITYVSVDRSGVPMPTPAPVRQALGGALGGAP